MKLYTTHCPKCKIIEKKLKDNNIHYEEITDTQLMLNKGINKVPVIETEDGTLLEYFEANKKVNEMIQMKESNK